ncbi:MAG: DUF2807 domain-containing protein [Bacteroidales bacterium]|nr:DUF2807 domain-containing protein [Bacteroidales bacterium]
MKKFVFVFLAAVAVYSCVFTGVSVHKGNGDIDLLCKDAGMVNASASGSGDISLSGTARSLKSNKSGSGDVLSDGLNILKE